MAEASRLTQTASKIIPHFHCSDARKTAEFYTEDLHFTLGGLNMDADTGGSNMCSVFMGRHADANLYLFEEPRETISPSGAMIAMGRDELDEFYQLLLSEGKAEIVDHVEDKPWGYRQFEVRDLDGNRIQFFRFLDDGGE